LVHVLRLELVSRSRREQAEGFLKNNLDLRAALVSHHAEAYFAAGRTEPAP
jgi:hypothetical protein